MNQAEEADGYGPQGREPARRRWWPVAAGVAGAVLVASVLLPAGRHQWALSIFRQPTRYTALSFKYAWLLPANGTVGRSTPLFFTVENEEGRSLTYRYVIRQTDPLGASQTLSDGVRTVASGATWTVDTKVRPSCVLSPCRVEVLLPGHPETIDYLVILRSPPARHRHRAASRARGHHRRTRS